MSSIINFRAGSVRSFRSHYKRAFTLAELLIVVSTIGVLTALLGPTLVRAKNSAKSTACKSNLRQIGIGLTLYLDTFRRFPLEQTCDASDNAVCIGYWWSDLLPYTGSNPKLFACPQDDYFLPSYAYNVNGTGHLVGVSYDGGSVSYFPEPPSVLGLGILGWLNRAVPESFVKVPSDMLAIGEIYAFGWPGSPTDWNPHGRQNHNAVFCDAHVESANQDTIPKRPNGQWWRFIPDAAHAKRWNNDNQPHPETWP
jgi:prepilin-type processing-associated H-X9-DG protein